MVICCGSHRKLVQVLVQEKERDGGVLAPLFGPPKTPARWVVMGGGEGWDKPILPLCETAHSYRDELTSFTLQPSSVWRWDCPPSYVQQPDWPYFVDEGGWDGSLAIWTGTGQDCCTAPQLMLPVGCGPVGSDILVSWTNLKNI